MKYKSFLNTNHVLSQGWCFRSELKPGKAYGTKAILKVDPKGAKYIDVDIDFVYKPDGPEDWITDNDIKSHVYKISLSHE